MSPGNDSDASSMTGERAHEPPAGQRVSPSTNESSCSISNGFGSIVACDSVALCRLRLYFADITITGTWASSGIGLLAREEGPAVHLGHHQIEQDDARPPAAKDLQGFAAIDGRLGLVAFVAQELTDEAAYVGIVIDDQDPPLCLYHRLPPPLAALLQRSLGEIRATDDRVRCGARQGHRRSRRLHCHRLLVAGLDDPIDGREQVLDIKRLGEIARAVIRGPRESLQVIKGRRQQQDGESSRTVRCA